MESAYLPCVVQALAGPDKTVFAYFSDGRITQFDMKPEIERGGVFEPLLNDGFFADALTVLNDTVAWDLSGRFDSRNFNDKDPITVYGGPAVKHPQAAMGLFFSAFLAVTLG